MTYRIAIVGGGTLGHTAPGLAVAERWSADGNQAASSSTAPGPDTARGPHGVNRRVPVPSLPRRPLFLGVAGGVEAAAVAAHGFPFEAIPAAPWLRARAAQRARVPWALVTSVRAARRILLREKVDAVLGLGGYVSAGPLLAARSLGLWTALHEANARAGVTNRLLGRVVHRVYLAWPSAQADFRGLLVPAGRVRVVGQPVRAAVPAPANGHHAPPTGATRQVLVLGGSEGSGVLNRHAPGVLGRAAARLARSGLRLTVRHQTGADIAPTLRSDYAAAAVEAEVVPFIDDMGAAYAAADLAITPAGAATLAELAVSGLPALLVPRRDVALDHQHTNATAHAATGASRAIDPARLTSAPDDLAVVVADLLCDVTTWTTMARAARGLAHPDAAATIAAELGGARNHSGIATTS